MSVQSTVAATVRPETIARNRWVHSIRVAGSSDGRNCPWQRGQSGQPKPEPVTRTTPPQTTTRNDATRLAYTRARKRGEKFTAFSLRPSAKSYCATSSFSGRALWTTGIRAKLYGCGGDVVAHSSVSASHGSSPAGRPLFSTMLSKKLHRNTAVEIAIMYAPIVETRFR